MNVRSVFAVLWVALPGIVVSDTPQTALEVARLHVDSIGVYVRDSSNVGESEGDLENILNGRDPETTTSSFLYGIRRNAAKLLTRGQADRWSGLLAERQPLLQRLHDERNVLRGRFFAEAWRLPLADGRERERMEAGLRGWLAVWLDITLQERIAKHQLCRDAWKVLDEEQRMRLRRGDWDSYVKKSLGHKRAYFGDRVVSRALGKPGDPEALSELSERLAGAHKKIQENLLAAERRWRILTFAQPTVSDDLLAIEWRRTADVLGAFFLNQAGHIDRLTRVGYDLKNADVRARVAAQPAATLKETADKVEAKLVAGADLLAKLQAAKPGPVRIPCEGDYRHHLQGVAIDASGDIHWSFTTTMVKTDKNGKKLKEIEVPNHHGDLCVVKDRLYVAVNFGPFNHPDGTADSWVHVYDLELNLLSKHRTPEVVYGAGGMDYRNGSFYVIGGLPASHDKNYVYEYDGEFSFVKRHEIDSGQTRLGIQTAAFIGGRWWFGCYGSPRELLIADVDFNLLGKHVFDCAYGIAAAPDGRILVAEGPCAKGRCRGALVHAIPDKKAGLRMLE